MFGFSWLRAVRFGLAPAVLVLISGGQTTSRADDETKAEAPAEPNQFPVEFVVNADDAPELKEWAENAAKVCVETYPMINRELASEGFTPPRRITLRISKDYRGVAATSGDRIIASADYFKAHPDDVGAIVHETIHVVQQYRGRRNPSWLVEGVADYVRFFKFEPPEAIGPINPRRARYNGSYRVTASFLNFLCETYDPAIVRTLNATMRAGDYKDSLFEELTGKPLAELDEQWRASLKTD